MVGTGRTSIAEICDISRANVADGAKSEALKCLKSLGTNGKHESNQERDFHTWLRGLYNVDLEPFKVSIPLNVTGFKLSETFRFVTGLKVAVLSYSNLEFKNVDGKPKSKSIFLFCFAV